MTATPLQLSRAPYMTIQRLEDREQLETFLKTDRLANAYLLGNLDPKYLPFCKWYGSQNGSIGFVALEYIGLSLPVVFFTGNAVANADQLREVKRHLPKRFHFHVIEAHFESFADVFKPTSHQRMLRMGLERSKYQRQETTTTPEPLGHRDTAAIMDLYQHYPDNLFEPYQLETGLYFAVRDEELGLSSISGIHVKSSDYDIAVIGNFVTHPERRGNGLATSCTTRLLDALFEDVSLVALNVQEQNEAAVAMFKKSGFEQNNVFYEGRVE